MAEFEFDLKSWNRTIIILTLPEKMRTSNLTNITQETVSCWVVSFSLQPTSRTLGSTCQSDRLSFGVSTKIDKNSQRLCRELNDFPLQFWLSFSFFFFCGDIMYVRNVLGTRPDLSADCICVFRNENFCHYLLDFLS